MFERVLDGDRSSPFGGDAGGSARQLSGSTVGGALNCVGEVVPCGGVSDVGHEIRSVA